MSELASLLALLPEATPSYLISLILSVARGFRQELAKCPTLLQLKQVASTELATGTRDGLGLGPGVTESRL